MMQWRTPGPHAISVSYHSDQDGGGTWFGQDYIPVLRRYQRRFATCLEWCAGPGFIGFNILSHDLCDRLVLVDSWQPCLSSVAETVRSNGLADRVQAFCAASLADWPDLGPIDLVVANPPHYLECPGDDNYQRLAVDPDWQAHRDFYQHIGSRLADDGMILMQENQAGSLGGVEDFRDMIETNGLEIADSFVSDQYWHQPGPWAQIYYIEIRRKKIQT